MECKQKETRMAHCHVESPKVSQKLIEACDRDLTVSFTVSIPLDVKN